MRVCFGAFDLNGDGFIDPPEMQTGFTSLYTSMAESGGTLHCGVRASLACCLRTARYFELAHADNATTSLCCADMKLDQMEISVAVATLVNSPQGGDLNVHAFTDALAEAGVPGEAIASCFRTDSGVCLGSSL
jgi:hypothetical protein